MFQKYRTVSHPQRQHPVWQQHRQVNKNNTTHCNGRDRPPPLQDDWRNSMQRAGTRTGVLCAHLLQELLFSPFPPQCAPWNAASTFSSSPLGAGPALTVTQVHCSPSKDLCLNKPEKVLGENTATELHCNLCARTKEMLSQMDFFTCAQMLASTTPVRSFCLWPSSLTSSRHWKNYCGKMLHEQTQHNHTKSTS